MLWKDLLLLKFENGFRVLSNNDPEDKFFVIEFKADFEVLYI